MSENPLKLNDWEVYFPNPNPLDKSGFIRACIVGPSDSGKSYLFEYFARYHLKRIYEVFIVFCSSDDQRKRYSTILETKLVYKNYDSSVIEAINKKQSELEAIGKPPIKVMIIYDDFANRSNKYDDTIFQQFISARHTCISLFMILHDMALLDRIARNMLTHLFVTRQITTVVYEKISEEFLLGPLFNDKNVPDMIKEAGKSRKVNFLSRLLNENTKNYYVVCVLINEYMKKQETGLSDILKTFKAPKMRELKK
jgi:hypothetical protein